MAFQETPDITDYVNRGVEILKANGILINPTDTSKSLVTDILAQEAPIEESPNKAIIPVIYVYPSKNFLSRTENIGRDALDLAGPKYFHLELYNVIVARGLNKQDAQVKCQIIGKQIRESYQHNLRMGKPTIPPSEPIAALNEVISVPFVLRSKSANIQAINIILRIQVPIEVLGTPPVITLLGANPFDVLPGQDPFVEQGATCHDARDGDISNDIVFGPIPPEVIAEAPPGTYFRTYDCTNSQGTPATQVLRTIVVI